MAPKPHREGETCRALVSGSQLCPGDAALLKAPGRWPATAAIATLHGAEPVQPCRDQVLRSWMQTGATAATIRAAVGRRAWRQLPLAASLGLSRPVAARPFLCVAPCRAWRARGPAAGRAKDQHGAEPLARGGGCPLTPQALQQPPAPRAKSAPAAALRSLPQLLGTSLPAKRKERSQGKHLPAAPAKFGRIPPHSPSGLPALSPLHLNSPPLAAGWERSGLGPRQPDLSAPIATEAREKCLSQASLLRSALEHSRPRSRR